MSALDQITHRDSDGDPVHGQLRKAVEKRCTSYLWVEGDTPAFRPALHPVIYGDGRALFTLSTINQRPRYWVIRGCSTWGCDRDIFASGPEFVDLVDDLLTNLEDRFGNGRCGYSGNSLFEPRRERIKCCQCEECQDRFVARWPMVDGSGGCSWSRMEWPKGFDSAPDARGASLLTSGAGR